MNQSSPIPTGSRYSVLEVELVEEGGGIAFAIDLLPIRFYFFSRERKKKRDALIDGFFLAW